MSKKAFLWVAIAGLMIIVFFDLHKSKIIASTSVADGDMQSFRGSLILRENKTCEIWLYGIMDRDKCNCEYRIEGNEVFIQKCESWIKEFDSIIIDSTKFSIKFVHN